MSGEGPGRAGPSTPPPSEGQSLTVEERQIVDLVKRVEKLESDSAAHTILLKELLKK